MITSALIMTLIFGAPTFAAMTPALWALFALGQVGNVKTAIKLERQFLIFLNSPAGRAWVAANGEAAIKWQQRQMEN